jgi:hypothetical protein
MAETLILLIFLLSPNFKEKKNFAVTTLGY